MLASRKRFSRQQPSSISLGIVVCWSIFAALVARVATIRRSDYVRRMTWRRPLHMLNNSGQGCRSSCTGFRWAEQRSYGLWRWRACIRRRSWWKVSLIDSSRPSSITCPILVMHGERDPWITSGETQALVARIDGPKQVVEFPNVGHDMPYVYPAPDLWVATVRQFLTQLE